MDTQSDNDEFDALNDETFGNDGETWEEDHHEKLAALTEEERLALKQSQSFFDLDGGEDDEFEALEPEEEVNGLHQNVSDNLAQLNLNQYRPLDNSGSGPPQDSAILNIGVHPLPPHPPQFPQQFPPAPHQMPPPMPPAHLNSQALHIHRMPAYAMPPQQQAYRPQEPFHDPAIMSMSSIPPPPQGFPQQILQQSHGAMSPGRGPMPPNQGVMLPNHGMMPPPHMPQPGMHQTGMPVGLILQHTCGHQGSVPISEPPPMPPPPHPMETPPPRMHHHQQRPQQFQHPHRQQQHHRQDHRESSYLREMNRRDREWQQHGHDDYDHPNWGHNDRRQRGGGGNRNRFNDRNKETFGEDFVEREQHQHNHHQRWRGLRVLVAKWKRASRPDLMPGHVQTLGILRGAREGRPSTGNPMLDLELQQQQAQDYDEYSGLMTQRERQWIVNIQLNQLKCENPFIDDYYFTVYQQKQQSEKLKRQAGPQQKRDEEGPQLLLPSESSIDKEREEYIPRQFENSLGKLQCVTVKAPRRIIDVGTVNHDVLEGANPAQKDARKFKQTLMELEHLYTLLIDIEDCEKKLGALPTNTSMHLQVKAQREETLKQLNVDLMPEVRRYLLVRKGKAFLSRALRLLDDNVVHTVCSMLFQLFPLVVKRDREVLENMWPEIKRHLLSSPPDLLIHYMKALNAGAIKQNMATYKNTLTVGLGSSVIILVVGLIEQIYNTLPDEEKKEIKEILNDLGTDVKETKDIAEPLDLINMSVPICIETPEMLEVFERLVKAGKTGRRRI